MKQLLVFLIFCVCIAITAFCFLLFQHYQDQKTHQTLTSDAKSVIQDIRSEMENNVDVLVSLKAFYDSSTFVDRQEFKTFSAPLLDGHPDVRAVEWAPVVSLDEREALKQTARDDGLENFLITQRNEKGEIVKASERKTYVPVFYLEPYQGNERALGYDLASNTQRLETLTMARRSKEAVATEPIELVQESGTKKGTLLIMAVYKNGDDGQTVLHGYLAVVLLVEDLIRHTLENKNSIFSVQVDDITDRRSRLPIFSDIDIHANTAFEYAEVINVVGRTWKVSLAANDLSSLSKNVINPYFILIFGLLFSALITFFMNTLIQQNKIIEAAVKKKTAENKEAEEEIEEHLTFQNMIMENIPDLLFVKDKDFKIVKANPAFLKIYPENIRDSVLGSTTIESYNKEEAEAFLKNDRIAFKEGFSGVEETLMLPDGRIRTLYTTKTLFKDPDGNEFILGVGRDITNIIQMKDDLKKRTESLELAEQAARMGHWRYNVSDQSIFWSDEVYSIHGVDKENYEPDLKGALSFYHKEDQDTVTTTLQHTIDNRVPFDFELRLIRKDGEMIHVYSHGKPELDKNGEVKALFGVIQDITIRKKAEEEILRSNEELERFAYIASHDLQEPLRMITNFTALLEEEYGESMDDQARKYMKFTTDASTRMQDLVSDLLEYSRIGEQNAGFTEFDANRQAQLVLDNLSEEIEEAKAKVTIDDLPMLYGSPIRFNRLIQNLIGNGIKYSPDDRNPDIKVKVEDKGVHWLFSVKDNGIGIKEEYLEQIFVIFKRLHNKNEYTGTGIGLAICKKIVESFGGQLWAESEHGKGSTFYFTVPKRQKD